jgi:hypothetical protein
MAHNMEKKREGVRCTWHRGTWGPVAGSCAGPTEAAAGRERTGEWGGTRGLRVENVGQLGKKGNGQGPREYSVGF